MFKELRFDIHIFSLTYLNRKPTSDHAGSHHISPLISDHWSLGVPLNPIHQGISISIPNQNNSFSLIPNHGIYTEPPFLLIISAMILILYNLEKLDRRTYSIEKSHKLKKMRDREG